MPGPEDFVWLTLGQLYGLLHEDIVWNMDARTVLSQSPSGVDSGRPLHSLHSLREVLTRLTEVKARREPVQRSIPLADVSDRRRTDDAIWTWSSVRRGSGCCSARCSPRKAAAANRYLLVEAGDESGLDIHVVAMVQQPAELVFGHPDEILGHVERDF
ncbi:NDP-hexose 2,3-dehydratase family protein [Streptomyces sp. NPDC056656]|uniref:NDP-hexose 2,3-dehydratase family protein n=1 Tax=Streptomyces sp. NPDC056656 TaxID=3345895 RepID=UPI003673F07C